MASPVAALAVAGGGVLELANRRAETQLGISARDLGRHVGELDLFAGLPDLAAALEQVQQHRGSAVLHEVEWAYNNETRCFDIELMTLPGGPRDGISVAIFCTDVSRYRTLTRDLELAHSQAESAYEQPQSTVEELESTNEELQSTNDELQTINDALRDRTSELDAANDFFEAVLESRQSAVAVVDTDLVVQAWNHRAADLWGLRSDEATRQHLLNLDIGLPTDRLGPLVRAALTGGSAAEPDQVGDGRVGGHSGSRGHGREAVFIDRAVRLTMEAVNRRGRTVEVAVTVAPLRYRDQDRRGAIIVMDQREGSAAG